MMSDEEADFEASANADELVVRAKSDRAAFSQLYERYYSEASRYCLRRLLIRSIAEAVVCDVFLQIASHLTTFPGRGDRITRASGRLLGGEISGQHLCRYGDQAHCNQASHGRESPVT
jgi:hypothetical protein